MAVKAKRGKRQGKRRMGGGDDGDWTPAGEKYILMVTATVVVPNKTALVVKPRKRVRRLLAARQGLGASGKGRGASRKAGVKEKAERKAKSYQLVADHVPSTLASTSEIVQAERYWTQNVRRIYRGMQQSVVYFPECYRERVIFLQSERRKIYILTRYDRSAAREQDQKPSLMYRIGISLRRAHSSLGCYSFFRHDWTAGAFYIYELPVRVEFLKQAALA